MVCRDERTCRIKYMNHYALRPAYLGWGGLIVGGAGSSVPLGWTHCGITSPKIISFQPESKPWSTDSTSAVLQMLIYLHSSNSMFSMPESKSRETWLALAFKPQDCAGSTSIFCTGVRGAEARGLVGEVAVGEVAPTTSCFSFSAPKADNRASRFLRISSWSGSLIPAVIMLSERVATLQSYTACPGCTLSPYEACKRPRWLPKEAAL